MSLLSNLIKRAGQDPRRIVLAEGTDPRVIHAAVKAQNDGIAHITLLGNLAQIRSLTRAAGDKDDAIKVVDPNLERQDYIQRYAQLLKHKAISQDAAKAAIQQPLNYANMMVRSGDADGSVAGAAHATSDVVRAALQIIGTSDETSLVSSFFLMIAPTTNPAILDMSANIPPALIYADCGLVIAPDTQQLAQIAAASADNGQLLLGIEPKIAMLSFSTKGSAQHELAQKPAKAAQILKTLRPDLHVDGELQFDAALLGDIAQTKARNSNVAGQANVFIFPDLNSGNIAYKITERLGRFTAIGPILQGLKKPANDLSRGCNADDIYNMIAITVIQAQGFQVMMR